MLIQTLTCKQLLQDSQSTEVISEVMILLGLLLNYQKGEFLSPYRTRIEDFANKTVVNSISACFSALSDSCRDQYIAIQDDAEEGLSVAGTLSWLSLGMIASKSQSGTNALTSEQTEAAFAAL
jgi:recombinational DNA repair protein RecT